VSHGKDQQGSQAVHDGESVSGFLVMDLRLDPQEQVLDVGLFSGIEVHDTGVFFKEGFKGHVTEKGKEPAEGFAAELDEDAVVVGTRSKARFVDNVFVDEHKGTLADVIGTLPYKVKTLALHKVVDLILIVKVFGGHGVLVIADNAVDGDAIGGFFEYCLAHV
jgi:hypothetical protein